MQGQAMIKEKLEQFRRRLLDMSRRNRLLNFKPKGRRSLEIVDQTAEDVYRWLVIEQKTLDFAPLGSVANAGDGVSDPSETPGENVEAPPDAPQTASSRKDADVPVKPMVLPPHGAQASPPADRHSPVTSDVADGVEPGRRTSRGFKAGDRLPTRLDEEALEKRLLFLAREAESALQEQGCNILYFALGLLDWVDPNDSDQNISAAPLVLVPVELVRRDARQPFRLRLLEDEPVVNPTLVELCRSNFRLELPPFDPESPEPLASFLQALEELVAQPYFKGWAVRRELHLGLFSFAKLLMYLDLDPTRWPEEAALGEHPLVTRLCGLAADEPVDYAPLDPNELDAQLHPQDTFQVVDADSSQQVAIVAAKNGTSMVIEGPPGTGKSQTITNIIAECLAAGKTILFIAEKAAALEVVKAKLDGVGLGEFALAMHSRQASKKAILEELDRALRFDAADPPPRAPEADELFELRNRLNDYVRRLHEKVEPLEFSRFEAMGQCATLREAPEAPFELADIRQWDRQQLREAEECVASLERALQRVGPPDGHPWRGVEAAEAPLPVRQRLPDAVSGLVGAIDEAQASGSELAALLQSSPPQCRQHAQRLVDVVDALLGAATLTSTSVLNQAWKDAGHRAKRLLACGKRLAELRAALAARWQAAAEEVDWTPVAAFRRLYGRSMLRWLRPTWHRDSRLIRAYLRPDVRLSQHQLLDDFETFREVKRLAAELREAQADADKLFGALWQGEASDWRRLQAHAAGMTAVSDLVARGETSAAALAAVCDEAGRRELGRLRKRFVLACNDMLEQRRAFRELLSIDLEAFLGDEPEAARFDT